MYTVLIWSAVRFHIRTIYNGVVSKVHLIMAEVHEALLSPLVPRSKEKIRFIKIIDLDKPLYYLCVFGVLASRRGIL